MHLLDLTLSTAAENLALDEALLEAAEEGALPGAVLRIWESPQIAVVIGRSSRRSEEVSLAYCEARGFPVLRRTSGGAAIVMGPGCLMYAVLLSLVERPELRMIDAAHRFVLGRLVQALEARHPGVSHCGTSDLAAGDKKFSGNSLRVGRNYLLYHGTLLYAFPLEAVAACLKNPPRQPEYRAGRAHGEFVANLDTTKADLREAVMAAFDAKVEIADWPENRTAELVAQKYSQESWNGRLP